ncbi:MAG: hypothetical protein AAF627_13945 [Myxococcota bacterium]
MVLARVTAELEIEIPGRWSAREHPAVLEQAEAMAQASLEGPSERLAEVFERASAFLEMSERELNRVKAHESVLRLRTEVGRQEPRAARALLKGVARLLETPGSLAVHVASSGKAHPARAWRAMAAGHPFDLFRAFVVLGHRDRYRSWGMKSFGLPDVVLEGDLFPQEASALMQSLLIEQIESPGELSPEWQLAEGIGPKVDVQWTMAQPADNPFGLQVLQPV